MTYPVYRSRDSEDVRVYVKKINDDEWEFTEERSGTVESVYSLPDDLAQAKLRELAWRDAGSFAKAYGRGPNNVR